MGGMKRKMILVREKKLKRMLLRLKVHNNPDGEGGI